MVIAQPVDAGSAAPATASVASSTPSGSNGVLRHARHILRQDGQVPFRLSHRKEWQFFTALRRAAPGLAAAELQATGGAE